MLCGKGEKKPEGIAVGIDGMMAHPLDVWEVVKKELRIQGLSFMSFVVAKEKNLTNAYGSGRLQL